MVPVFHYWRSANKISKFLILRKALYRIISPETYDNKTRDPWAIPGFADVILSFTESAKPGITKLVCIWLASSHGSELDYVCKIKFIFHTKCTLSSKTWFNGAKPGFPIAIVKPGFAIAKLQNQSQNIAKPGFALLNLVLLLKNLVLLRKTWFIRAKPGLPNVQCQQKNPKSRDYHSSGKRGLPSFHWNGGHEDWDFPVDTDHKWWILFIFISYQNMWIVHVYDRKKSLMFL